MRQSVACALLLYAFAVFIADKKIRPCSVIAIGCAYFFHRSTLYGIVLLALPLVIMKVDRKGLRYLFYALLVIAPLAMTQVSQFLIDSGIADSHMRYYLGVFVTGSVDQDWNINPLGRYSIAYLLMYSALVFLPFLYTSSTFESHHSSRSHKARTCDADQALDVIKRLNVTGYLVYVVLLISLSTMYGMRFSIFLDFFLMLSIPLSCEGKLSLQKKLLFSMLLVAIWYVWIFCLGWSASSIYRLSF